MNLFLVVKHKKKKVWLGFNFCCCDGLFLHSRFSIRSHGSLKLGITNEWADTSDDASVDLFEYLKSLI